MNNSKSINQNVFCLNLILKYRIIFGYYHNVTCCGYKRILLKIVSVLISAAILCKGIKCPLFKQGDFIWAAKAFKYIAYVICALTTENSYLINYFNADICDDILCSKKIYHKIHKFIIQYIVFLHIFYTMFGLSYYCTGNYPCGGSWVDFSVLIYLRLAIDLGFMPVILILFLLYLRTSYLCAKIRKEAVHLTTAFNWKKYLNLYIKHIETLEKTDWPMKFMMFLHLIVSFIDISKTQFYVVLLCKSNALNHFSSFNISVMMVYIIYYYIKVFCPSVIMEFTLKELDSLKNEIADKMITCTDARRKEQLHKMLTRFHSRPLTYSIWRSLWIDSSLPLGFLSLQATCLVCLLQFSHVLEK